MAQADRQSSSDEQYDRDIKTLQTSISKLTEHSKQHLNQKYGLTEAFYQKFRTQEEALKLCDEAMSTLASDYVKHLTSFQTTTDPIETLRALDSAEAVWQAESTIIRHLDGEGSEATFLDQMRQQSYQVLARRLETAAQACQTDGTAENTALCIGIMSVMDTILGELGYPVESTERQQWRSLAAKFR